MRPPAAKKTKNNRMVQWRHSAESGWGMGTRDGQELSYLCHGREGKKFWVRSECSGEPQKDSEEMGGS